MQRVAAENPRILNLESDYLERQPRVIVQIDRNKAADLGVSLQTVGRTLETMMGSRIVTTFERAGEEYDVMLQARETQRASVGDLDNLYVRSDKNGDLVPLSALVRIEERAGPTGAAPHGSHARHRARRFAGARIRARRGRGVHGAGDPRGSARARRSSTTARPTSSRNPATRCGSPSRSRCWWCTWCSRRSSRASSTRS